MTDESREEMQFVQGLMALKFAFIDGDIQYKSDKFGDSYKIWASRTIDDAIEHIVRSRTNTKLNTLFIMSKNHTKTNTLGTFSLLVRAYANCCLNIQKLWNGLH